MTRSVKNLSRLAALGFVIALACTARADVDQRWEYQQKSPDDGYPAALYHSSDGKSVIFRASCDIMAGEFVLVYFGNGEEEVDQNGAITLIGPAGELDLTTRFIDGVLEGRAAARAPELRAWVSADKHEIMTYDGEGDPWFVGKAEPLKQIVGPCG